MVRPAHVRDLPVVARIYQCVWHEIYGAHMPRAECEARDETFFLNRAAGLMPNLFVGEDAGTVVGFAAWNGALLGQLFLDATARGSSLAQRLLEAAEHGLRDQGVREADLRCLVGNVRAKRFYEHAGWRVTETVAQPVRGDVAGETRPFWAMRKRLAPRVL